MPGIKTSIELRDGISAVLNNIAAARERDTRAMAAASTQMTAVVSSARQQDQVLRQKDNTLRNTSNTAQMAAIREARLAETLRSESAEVTLLSARYDNLRERLQQQILLTMTAEENHRRVARQYGASSQEAQKAYAAVLKAQAAEIQLQESIYKTGEKIGDSMASTTHDIGENFIQVIAGAHSFEGAAQSAINAVTSSMAATIPVAGAVIGVITMIVNRVKDLKDQAVAVGNSIVNFAQRNAPATFDLSIGGAAQIDQQSTMVSAMIGHQAVGESYYNRLRQYALKTGREMSELTTATQQFLTFTKNTDKLMGLTEVANTLALRNPQQGIGGAAYAIQEALSGQYRSLQTRFNFSSQQLEPIKKAVSDGNLLGITEAFKDALSKAGYTDAVVEAFQNTVPQRWERLINSAKDRLANSGVKALERLEPVLKRIEDWSNSEKADKVFGWVENGLVKLASTAELAFGVIETGVDWVVANWPQIEPMVWGVVGAFTALSTIDLVSTLIDKMNNPLFWIIGMLGIAAGALTTLRQENDDTVSGISAGWQQGLNDLDKVKLGFVDFSTAITTTVLNMAIGVLNTFGWMLDAMIWQLNTFGGQKIEWKSSDLTQALKERVDSMAVNAETQKADLVNSAEKRLRRETIQNQADQREKDYRQNLLLGTGQFDMREAARRGMTPSVRTNVEDLWNQRLGEDNIVAAINSAGKGIQDKLDKSNEELAWMRELAEQQYINYQISLQPNVQVSTGPINNGQDANEIARTIAKKLDEEYKSSMSGVLKGVYST